MNINGKHIDCGSQQELTTQIELSVEQFELIHDSKIEHKIPGAQ
jgi:hypothetical protein